MAYFLQQTVNGIRAAQRLKAAETKARGLVLIADGSDSGRFGQRRQIAQRRRCIARPGTNDPRRPLIRLPAEDSPLRRTVRTPPIRRRIVAMA